jgi:hypothetical protein
VIIRYADTNPDATTAPGASYLNSGGYKIYVWGGTGSITF